MIGEHHAPVSQERRRGAFPARPLRRNARARLICVALLVGCAGLLSGCASRQEVEFTNSIPSDYRQRHPIVVKEKTQTVHLFIGKSNGSLSREQRAEVYGFARAWRNDATGGVIIDVPHGSNNAAAAGGAAAEAKRILIASGIPARAVVTRPYRVADVQQLATVRLNYPRMAAEAGPCGEWPADLGANTLNSLENKPYWNLGCASQRNLAAMVANPADLVQPRAETPASAARRSVMFGNYLRGEVTSSKEPDSFNAAKISDVGK
jgi:pilus assembly protein CpaD